jgi:hypothetical protein
MKYKYIIGGIIAYILLGLYTGIIVYMIYEMFMCAGRPDCLVIPSAGINYVLTTVGGLISALVISKLAITTPGTDPSLFEYIAQDTTRFARIVTWFYLGLWTISGLFSLVLGVLIYPDTCKTLSDIGTTWLGTAVAAGWAYFGLDPQKK